MEFLDRKEELKELKRVLASDTAPRFVVMYGRRRLGKSTLIKKALDPGSIYYMAGDFVDQVQKEMLVTQLSEKFPAMKLSNPRSWEDIFTMLNLLATEQFTLCLDEFPYMVKHAPELPSVIQRLVDSKQLKYNLVICGSSQRMMQNMILSQAEPLFGRAGSIMDIRPIPISYLQEGLRLSPIETIEEYSVWGGVPRYWELREEYDSLEDAIQSTLLTPTGVLYDEPRRLFLDDMMSTVQSESLMAVVAAGANRLSEIASRMGRDATALSGPLDRLIQMNYIRREIPFGESIKKSKKGIYRINDPMMDFYYTFIVPNLSAIGRGRKSFVANEIKARFNEYVARYWEYLCREAVSGNRLFGHFWREASRWWGGIKTETGLKELEFDVMAESVDGGALLVGECKWTNPEMATKLIERLTEKASHLPLAKSHAIIPVLFLKNRPKDLEAASGIRILYPEDIITLSYGEIPSSED